MVLKCGTIIPFQYKNIKKLLLLSATDYADELTICDVKNVVCSAFTVQNCEFFNKKIGFLIPDELLIPYLEQRHDLTNFVVEVVDVNNRSVEEIDVDFKTDPLVSDESKRALECSDYEVPVTKRSKQIANCIDSHLEDILETSEGQAMWYDFKATNRLSEKDRVLLIKLVLTYEMKNLLMSKSALSIDSQRYSDLAAGIVRKFPGEDCATYFIPQSKSLKWIASGGLYDHFSDMKCQYLRMRGAKRYSNSEKKVLVDDDFPELEHLVEITGEWNSYFQAWQQSFDIRKVYVHNIDKPLVYFEKFIASVDENALELVAYDFEMLHPGKGNRLLDSWDQMSEKIFTEAIVCCRNDVPRIMDLYGNIPQLSGFMMLGYFLENYESDVRAFETDDPGNLIVHIEEIDGKPVDVFKEYCQTRHQLAPMVFATGKNTEKLSFYVLVGESLYCTETALKAVDFCFKCFQILQLSYPLRQQRVWQVIQSAFYDIHKHEDDLSCENFLNIFKSS